MASTLPAVFCALVALAFWTAVGYPVARRLLPRPLAAPFAPIAGWAMHGALALPFFFVVPFSTASVAAFAVAVLAVSWGVARIAPVDLDATDGSLDAAVSPWACTLAALLAMAVAMAIVPKHAGDAVRLAVPIFDHAKVALVDDIARMGMPPGNPFFAHDGGSGRLSYYYLWHFSAAELVRVLRVSGWEAEIAMTFFSAFTSLLAMMALAVRFSGRRAAAAWVVAVAATSSARVVFLAIFGRATVDGVVPQPGGFGGWLFQSSWVPQHLAATTCVLLAVLLIDRLARRPRASTAVVLALVAAAAFESSTWIGGVTFAVVALIVVPPTIVRTRPSARVGLLVCLAVVGGLTLALIWPLLADQLAASALRQSGTPVVFRAFEVLGDLVPVTVGTWLDKPAFWLLLLPMEFTVAFCAGLPVLGRTLFRGSAIDGARSLAGAGIAALLVAWLLASTLADNNDLAWRAVLLASTILIVFASAGIASWVAAGRWVAVGLASVALVAGLPETALLIQRNFTGQVRADDVAFAEAPKLWARVRALSAPDERVANDPLALEDLTPWPVNLSWALLADRRSCYAGWELAQVYTSVPHARLRAIDAQFIRVFAGRALPGDAKDLADVYDCRIAVVMPQDGAWARDPFRDDAFWRVVDDTPAWRIYRAR